MELVLSPHGVYDEHVRPRAIYMSHFFGRCECGQTLKTVQYSTKEKFQPQKDKKKGSVKNAPGAPVSHRPLETRGPRRVCAQELLRQKHVVARTVVPATSV